MADLLATIGNKITERWVAGIVAPGLLYVAIAGWALLAGHGHATDLPWLADRLTHLWQQHYASDPAAAVVATAAVLVAASLAGLAAIVIAEDGVHRLWTLRGPQRRLETRRRRTEAGWAGRDPRPPQRYLPQRATVIAERFRLIGERVHAQYGLSVATAWPRIWILASGGTRTLIGTAYRRYYTDATLAAWGLLYLLLIPLWWPAVVIAAAAAAAALALGYRRARTSSTTLATLIEATVDVHTTDLAQALGVDLPEGRLTREEGNRINNILNKRA